MKPRQYDHGKRFGVVAVVAIIAVTAATFFFLGRSWQSVQSVEPASSAVSPKSGTPSVAEKPAVAQVALAPVSAPEPPFRLRPVTEADSDKVGMGCRCSFYLGGSGPELLIAGGDDLAVFRPNGSQKVCPLKENDLQAMVDGHARIDCGSSRLLIGEYGRRKPGLDGHSSAAKLTVIYSGAERVLDGTWGCFC